MRLMKVLCVYDDSANLASAMDAFIRFGGLCMDKSCEKKCNSDKRQ